LCRRGCWASCGGGSTSSEADGDPVAPGAETLDFPIHGGRGYAGVSLASPLTFDRNPSHRDQKAKQTWPSSASDKLCGEWKTSVSCSGKDATSTTSACPGNATG